jgi:hypothetical protein
MNLATSNMVLQTRAASPIADGIEPSVSAISWGAILAGAVAAAALSLILLALGSGLGLSAVSPWTYEGASAKTLGIGAIVWLFLMSACASGLGGYIAGRLRTKWRDIDGNEAYFRDTAHGFLAWAVATVVSAAILTSAASSMVGTAATASSAAVTTGVGAVATSAAALQPDAKGSEAGSGYFVDMMLRTDRAPDAGFDAAAARAEIGGIVAKSLRDGEVSAGDKAYLAQTIARRTGISQADAEQRVTQVTNAAKLAADAAAAKAREVADAARRATAYLALWIFASLLAGAFFAALAATLGGRQRDGQPFHRAAMPT